MGKKLIIKGADFSGVAVPSTYAYTVGELLTEKGFYQVSSDGQSISFESRPSSAWRSAILELHDNMYVENATAVSLEGSIDTTHNISDIPEIIFLSSNDVSGFIQGSQIYVPSGSPTGYFATFAGMLNPPAGAIYVIINTNLEQGGSEDALISWE